MKVVIILLMICVTSVMAQTRRFTLSGSATVPIHLDHNRIFLAAKVLLPGGKSETVEVWVDNGTQDLVISECLAKKLGLFMMQDSATGETRATPPKKISVGGLPIDLSRLKQVEIQKGSTVGPGLKADMNLPASVLCQYDVVIDYPGRSMTLGDPGAVHFTGKAVAGYFNPENHLIQLPAEVGANRFNLALDVGTPVTFIAGDLLSRFSNDYPHWPSMYGAVGIANLWGLDDEPHWKLLKISRLKYGKIQFPDMMAVSFPQDRLEYFQKRAGIPTAGLIGAASLLGYRIGIDYAHGTIYFDRLEKPVEPNMSLIGLTLRPEAGGGYRILGVVRYHRRPTLTGVENGDSLLRVNGQDVNGLTMGAIWRLLQGPPGKRKELTVERDGKIFTVTAVTRCFLCK